MASTEIGEEGVLLDLQTKDYYSLNKTGMLIWQLLSQKRTPADIAQALHRDYQVSEQDARRSTEGFIQSLAANGLIESHEQSDEV